MRIRIDVDMNANIAPFVVWFAHMGLSVTISLL
jgi:hypothetical protein